MTTLAVGRVRRPVERVIVVMVVFSRGPRPVVLVHGRRRPPPAPRRPLLLRVSRVVHATAAAQRRRGWRGLSGTGHRRGRRARGHAYLMATGRLVIVATGAAALHRHGTRATPTATQLIPVRGPAYRLQPHAVRVGLFEQVFPYVLHISTIYNRGGQHE